MPKLQERTWFNDLVRVTNGQEFDHPESGAIEAQTGYSTLIIPSLISYVANSDKDFGVKSFPNLSDNRNWYQMSTQNGNYGSWAEWQNVTIHVPEDKSALSDEPFKLSPPATATIQPTEEQAAAPEEQTTASEEQATAPIENGEDSIGPLPYLLFFGALVTIGIILLVLLRRRQEKK
jgi:hypothetical protein